MKNITILVAGLLIALLSRSSFAQVTNGGFESWTNNDPDNWYTLDFFWDAVTPSNDSHSGSYSAKMEIVNYGEEPISAILNTYFPMTGRPASLNGYYKFLPKNASDVLTIGVILFKSSIMSSVGYGNWETGTAAAGYQSFSIPIDYISTDNPDSAWIYITLDDTSETPGAGAVALLDDLAFSGTTSVVQNGNNIPSEFTLKQNYPNPFNPSTKIEFYVPDESFVELKVFDVLGKEVATLAKDVYPAGSYKADFSGAALPSGIYITRLNATSKNGSSFTRTIKMNLLK